MMTRAHAIRLVFAAALAVAGACGGGPTKPTDQCDGLRISAQTTAIAAGGTTGTITVTAPASCTWRASSTATWLSLAMSGGMGSATIAFTVYPNPTTDPRSTVVAVGSATLTLQQEPLVADNCSPESYTITPAFRSAPTGGASFVVTVRAPWGCIWATNASASWLSLSDPGPGLDASGFAGNGNGEVFVEVAPNAGADIRTGTATIGRQTLTVTQDGTARTACSYSISPTSANFTAAGGTGTFVVTTTNVCSWAIDVTASGEDFVRWSGSRFGSGTQTVTYTVKPNDWNMSRSGALAVYGDSGMAQKPIALFTVHQSDKLP